jgi:DNA-binding XRE family transcriptional regulator
LRIDKISKSEKGFCNLEKEEKTEENLVKKTCRELGITQKELAEKIGVTDRTLSKYVTTKYIPKNIINHINLIIENNNQNKLIDSLKFSIQNLK